MNQKFKNNDIVYVNSDAFTAEKCKVVEFVKKEDNLSFYKIYLEFLLCNKNKCV